MATAAAGSLGNNGAFNTQSNAAAVSFTLHMEHLGGFLPLLKVLYFIKSNTDDALFLITEVLYAFMLFFLLLTHCYLCYLENL